MYVTLYPPSPALSRLLSPLFLTAGEGSVQLTFGVQSIYYVGGFGSEHFIGYIPLEMYQAALDADLGAEVSVGGRVLVTQDPGRLGLD